MPSCCAASARTSARSCGLIADSSAAPRSKAWSGATRASPERPPPQLRGRRPAGPAGRARAASAARVLPAEELDRRAFRLPAGQLGEPDDRALAARVGDVDQFLTAV